MKKSEISLFVLLLFTIVYSVAGNPKNETWSGAYFLVNYITMFVLFKGHKNKINRVIGMALSVSIIGFIIIKYFTTFTYERYYTIIPLLISIISIYKLDKRTWER